MTEQKVSLTLMDGQTQFAALARCFDPEENLIEIRADDGSSRSHDLAEVCSVLLERDLECYVPLDEGKVEEVETMGGAFYKVRVPMDQDFQTGFYGKLLEPREGFLNIFFTYLGVRSRRRVEPLGGILAEQGVVSRGAVEEALEVQRQAQEKKVGDILSEEARLPKETIEQTLQRVMKDRKAPRMKVGDILVSAGLVTREQVEHALSSQSRDKKKPLGVILVERGLVTEKQVLTALASKFRLPFVDLDTVQPTREALTALSPEIIKELEVLPLEIRDNTLVVASSQPANHAAIADALRFRVQRRVEVVVATTDQIKKAIDGQFVKAEEQVQDLLGSLNIEDLAIEEEKEEKGVAETDSLLIKLLNKILIEGYQRGASDIHVEPGGGPEPVIVRYRVDGICQVAHKIPKNYKKAIISRIKILAGLDITEHRRPQSGKILTRFANQKVEFRVEVTPTVGGQEDAVLRILSAAKPMPLEAMGFSPANLRNVLDILTKPYGIFLCVGPTGSGKTTTLHSALGHINQPTRKIWTAEDPVEITQPGLRQVQMQPKIGFTFAEALRSFLRADPDVIMIGEMRDTETAKIGVEASITGHLVISTLHTNSAPETVVRLIEMGVEPVHFADALLGVLAQRLARRFCPKCMSVYHPERREFEFLMELYGGELYRQDKLPEYAADFTLGRLQGCDACEGSGYKGRLAVHELLVGTDAVKDAIRHRRGVDELRQIGIHEGMRPLMQDGIYKILSRQTDLEQIKRVCV